jgi:hypothetical protein
MGQQQLIVYMRGEVVGAALQVLRERLELTPHGRMSDDWDQNFGRRYLRGPDQGQADISLLRYADDDWRYQIFTTGELIPLDEIEQLREQMLAAAEEAGLTVYRQYPMPGEELIEPERLLAARRRLAAWRSENSGKPGHIVTTKDLDHYTIKQKDEWLVFSPPGRASRVYLVSDDTVYSFSPAWETLETAVENARRA